MNAMILAAGLGKRLKPITDKIPKPLISINGETPIKKHLENLDKANFSTVVINLSHLGFKICRQFGNKFGKNLSIRYSFEPKGALETAGGIAYAEPWDKVDEPFLVLNGDIWSDWDAKEAYALGNEKRKKKLWGFLIMVNTLNEKHGDFFLNSKSRLLTTVDSSKKEKNLYEKLTFSGFGVYTSKMFSSVIKGERTALKPIFDFGINSRLILGRKHDGEWVDIGSHEELEKLKLEMTKTKSQRVN